MPCPPRCHPCLACPPSSLLAKPLFHPPSAEPSPVAFCKLVFRLRPGLRPRLAMQRRGANAIRPSPSRRPWPCQLLPDHGSSASHHGTERTDWLARRCLRGPGPVCGARLRLVRKRGRGDRRGVSQRVERSAVPLRCLRGRETQNRPI